MGLITKASAPPAEKSATVKAAKAPTRTAPSTMASSLATPLCSSNHFVIRLMIGPILSIALPTALKTWVAMGSRATKTLFFSFVSFSPKSCVSPEAPMMESLPLVIEPTMSS